MKQMFIEKGIELVAKRDDVPAITMERSHFESILQNLLSNGLKFTPSGGRVSASMHHIANQLIIEVSDTGIGLRAEDKERIFDKFVQVKPTDASTPGSIGLGLAIVGEIVTAYKGKIEVESEIGKGSTFKVSLPV
jgi:signal transduction histidine kinase